MTVSYTAEVATCSGFGCFLKLLFRWKGSIYKLVWPDLLLFLGSYFSLSILYRWFLTEHQQCIFERFSQHCEKYGNLIPVSFVLGFYVSIVVGRWWDQYRTIPWPDSIAVFVSANIHGQDEKGRLMRRTIMRYCCMCLTQCFSNISPRVKQRFPTMDHFVEAGLLLQNEKDIIDDVNKSVPAYSKHWLPIVWAASIVTRARKEGKIRDDFAVKTILDELNKFRGQCGLLMHYDWISVPLVYTQVVTLAVYSYFFAAVMGSQWLDPSHPTVEKKQMDIVFPLFTVLQFFFYMGWLKVAECIINPFGNDDDDFELNWMVDRNLQVSYLIVDEMHHEHPELCKDQYWDEIFPHELPYTVASEQYREEPPVNSTAKIHVSSKGSELVSPPSVKSINQMSDLDGYMGRRTSIAQSKRGSFVRRERTASMRSTASQSTLAESISGKLSRAASITSVFKRMFSRERDNLNSPAVVDGGLPNWSGSVANVHRNVAEDVIEEVDENLLTVMSMRAEKKPTVQDVFGTPNKQTEILVEESPEITESKSLLSKDEEHEVPEQGSSYQRPSFAARKSPGHLRLTCSMTPDSQTSGISTDSAATTSSVFETDSNSKDDPLSRESESGNKFIPAASSSVAAAPLAETEEDDPDDTMDDLQVKKLSQGSTGEKFTKKLAKTFGFKDKKQNEEDERSEQHLLSDISNKDDTHTSP